MADDNTYLSLVTTERLIQEIFDRNDRVIVIIERDLGGNQTDLLTAWHGGFSSALSLAQRFQNKLLKSDPNI